MTRVLIGLFLLAGTLLGSQLLAGQRRVQTDAQGFFRGHAGECQPLASRTFGLHGVSILYGHAPGLNSLGKLKSYRDDRSSYRFGLPVVAWYRLPTGDGWPNPAGSLMSMRDLKIEEWIQLPSNADIYKLSLLHGFRRPGIEKAVSAFNKNCQRIYGAPQMLMTIFDTGKVLQRLTAESQAQYLQTGSGFVGLGSGVHVERDCTRLHVAIEILGGDSQVAAAIEQLMGMQVISAWTAFEVLAEDLWVEALNSRPSLGLVALNALPDPKDDEKEASRKQKIKLHIPWWLAIDPEFDLNTNIGTLLRNEWDFARRDETEDAYRKAFRRNDNEIEEILRDQLLGWLVATRNVLVHNGGSADDEFIKLVKQHPILNQSEKGKPIPMDGNLAGELSAAAISQGLKLLAFVDAKLEKIPERT